MLPTSSRGCPVVWLEPLGVVTKPAPYISVRDTLQLPQAASLLPRASLPRSSRRNPEQSRDEQSSLPLASRAPRRPQHLRPIPADALPAPPEPALHWW